MTDARLKLGRIGEDAGVEYLQRLGMKILQRNVHTPVVEIGLVAIDDEPRFSSNSRPCAVRHSGVPPKPSARAKSGRSFGLPNGP